MVVREHDGGGVSRQRGLHHFARIHAGPTQRPAKKLMRLDQAILRIKEQYDEHFVLQIRAVQLEPFTYYGGRGPKPALPSCASPSHVARVRAPRRACGKPA